MVTIFESTVGAESAWLLAASAAWESENTCFGYRANTPADIDGMRVLLAADGDRRVGYLLMRPSLSRNMTSVMPEGTAYMEVEELYVLPECRSTGIGRELFAAAEAIARVEGFSYILLSTATKNAEAILHFYIEEVGMTFWSARLFKPLKARSSLTVRPATAADLPEMRRIGAAARSFMRRTGNPHQWGDQKPTDAQLTADIERGVSYLVEEEGRPCAMFAFIVGEDPTYRIIEGQWLNAEPYGTIHRIASDETAHGVLETALGFCRTRTKNVRIDTHEDNAVMQHLLGKYGFARCGIIHLENGDPRIAFQKVFPAAENPWAEKAKSFRRLPYHTRIDPVAQVRFVPDDSFLHYHAEPVAAAFPFTLRAGDSVVLDLGDHAVGYLHSHLAFDGAIPDSPVKLRFEYAERPVELMQKSYSGCLGDGWLQEETRQLVFLPDSIVSERRFAFRYVRVTRLDNARFPVTVDEIYADSLSAVDKLPPFVTDDAQLNAIDEMALKTLKSCEQDVFEDGPKRDRRLWTGDLRLQALTDYVSYRNTALVKRCLYLFAAHRMADGAVAPYVFPDSPPYIDDWGFTDYSLFFGVCLADYAEHTGDWSVPAELYDVARLQLDLAMAHFDGAALQAPFFIDWCPDLDKEVAALGVTLYALCRLCFLAEHLGRDTVTLEAAERRLSAALKARRKGDLFVTSGGQISWHSQVWAVLSGVLTPGESAAVLAATSAAAPAFSMHTPYMHHYYVEALLAAGDRAAAEEHIRTYWGGMLRAGFDRFPEVYAPGDPDDSPYGDALINSACHAWSCSSAYFIRQYFAKDASV